MAGMSETEMQCRMNIHDHATYFFSKIGYCSNNMVATEMGWFHERAAWRYFDILHGYESDKARDWIRDNTGFLAYSGDRTKFETNF